MNSNEFRPLFDRHVAFVWRVLRRHGVPPNELEDGCQEVFLLLFKRYAEFEHRSSLRTFLYGIAVRVASALRRRAHHRREVPTADVLALCPGDDGFAASLKHEARQLMAAALSELTPAKREVFVLYELEAMTMAEVSAALGVPENTALYRLYAAREAIAAFVRRRETRAKAVASVAAAHAINWRAKKEVAS